MVIKDKVVSWFIRNIMISQTEIINKPGFIVCKVTNKDRETFLREIVIPEEIFIKLENEIVKKYGNEGKSVLYSAGKRFGYAYSLISNFKQFDKKDEKDFLDFLYFFVRYIESVWANKIKYEVDLSRKKLTFNMDNFIVCNKNGKGYLIVEGCTAGFWSYMMHDETIEGYQTKCQGRGDKKCVMTYAPGTYFGKKFPYNKTISLKNLEMLEDYYNINLIREARYAKISFVDMVNSGFFEYKGGKLKCFDKRHILVGSSLMYLLEMELKKVSGYNKIFFDVCFNFGKNLMEQQENKDYQKFITTYLSSLGWGDIAIVVKNDKFIVNSDFFPWTKFSDKIDFVFFRGLVSGMLTMALGRKVILKKFETNLLSGFMTLTIFE